VFSTNFGASQLAGFAVTTVEINESALPLAKTAKAACEVDPGAGTRDRRS